MQTETQKILDDEVNGGSDKALDKSDKPILGQESNKLSEDEHSQSLDKPDNKDDLSWGVGILFELVSIRLSQAVPYLSATGVVLMFAYCGFYINFIPRGLVLGDSLFLILLTLWFGFMYTIVLALGTFIVISIASPFLEYLRYGRQRLEIWTFFLISSALLIFYFYQSYKYLSGGDFSDALFAGLAFLIPGFGYLLLIPKGDSAKKPRKKLNETQKKIIPWVVFLLLVFPLMLKTSFGERLLFGAFKAYGIRNEGVSLLLSKENYSKVLTSSKAYKIPLFGCNEKSKDEYIVHNMDVLWHGTGNVSLVAFNELGLEPKDKSKPITLELDSAGVSVLSTKRLLPITRCIKLSANAIFDSYSATLTSEGKEILNDVSRDINTNIEKNNLTITSAKITGYSDRMPVLKADDSNLDLSLRRAESVYKELDPVLSHVANDYLSVTGKGVLNPVSKCSIQLSQSDLKQCMSVDRRVEIQLTFNRKNNE
ncbi:OmpA family protein [Photobacterium satsumensis]|uniref:OmpA family protein n=1 Tax=Photobacterium satsumensis TaxID=2910239 RepID=UPI003D11ABCE